jgi:trimethylamine--corrinoid protein Co-methyltransferase
MRLQFSALSEAEQETIHEAALTILNKIGLRIKSAHLLGRLARRGVPQDATTGTVYLPPSVAAEALAVAPRTWQRADQDGSPLPDPTDQPFFIARVLLNQVLDYASSTPRPPRTRDIVNLIRLAEGLPQSRIVYKVDCPCADVPEPYTYLETIATLYRHTRKHILANPINLEATRYYVELGEAATGRPISQQPWLLCGIAVTSPLTLDQDSAESLLFLTDRRAPVNCFGMPISGASAPLTLAGMLVQHTAEVLGLISIVQLLAPGTPVGYGGMCTAMDLRTGNLSMAAPAVSLLANATVSMARHSGFPAYSPANYTDACVQDVQCGVEKAISSLLGMASGADVGMFGGDLHDAMTISYEQLLIDYEIWELASRLLRGIQVDADTLAVEAIERIGHTGDWLTDAHTLNWLRRNEHAFGTLFVRAEVARQAGASALEHAHQRVEQILTDGRPSPVPPDTVQRVEDYVTQEKRAIQARLG